MNQTNEEAKTAQLPSDTKDKTMYTVNVFFAGSIVSSVDLLASNEEQAKAMAEELINYETKKYIKK